MSSKRYHCQLTHELDLGTQRFLIPTVFRMWVPLAFPTPRGFTKDIALRYWCGATNTCVVYMNKLVSVCKDPLVLLLPKISIVWSLCAYLKMTVFLKTTIPSVGNLCNMPFLKKVKWNHLISFAHIFSVSTICMMYNDDVVYHTLSHLVRGPWW